ncbi:hypothetical protein UZ221_23075, partial [Escherichia coli]|nr:hypothetical protein [Escherichia coli]
TTKERVEAPPTTTSMREDLRDIWQNDQWRIVGLLTIFCVGNLIGSALAKPLTDWKCKVTIFWWTNALLAVISLA